jgi:PilZ domain
VVARPKAAWQRDATVHDLSLGGASLTLSGSLTLGDEVVVSFFAPSLWDPLALPARVAWVTAAKEVGGVTAGLAFEPRDPAAVFALFELVSTVAP